MALLTTSEISKHIKIEMFDYNSLTDDLVEVYSSYEEKFNSLFEQYSDAWGLENCYFYIKNSNFCNASATKFGKFNLINITNGYPILMDKKFHAKFFKNLLIVALINSKDISAAFVDVLEKFDDEVKEFIHDCSIKFTFHHEFRHILQFNYSPLNKNFDFSENFSSDSIFQMTKHAWEYDADRNAIYRVLRFANEKYTELGLNTQDQLRCIFYIALSSIIITKNLFYFNVIDDHTNSKSIKPKVFYTKKFSHPHSLARIDNAITYFIDCANDEHVNLNMDLQETINNTLIINKLYFDSLTNSTEFTEQFVNEWGANSDKINAYNNELYEFSIRNKAIKNLLIYTGTKYGA